MPIDSVSRRSFLRTSALTAASGSTLYAASAAPAKALNANARIRIGCIGVGGRGSVHVATLAKLRQAGTPIDLIAVSDVYRPRQDRAADLVNRETHTECKKYEDYRDLLADKNIDAVCIATPDHWHAKQTIDALAAGKHVYCEKPMTHTIQEANDVVAAWKASGKVMQVGVQTTSIPAWSRCCELLNEGRIGKVVQFQTEIFRNSESGQWRGRLEKEMSPQTVNWRRFLGVEEGLAPDMPFDRAKFAQWRCYWPFGCGIYTDLFVHRLSAMLKGTGLRYPARVVAAGGIFLEYDGRDVPDVATLVVDYHEGVQGLLVSTMCCAETPLQQLIRGHHGSFIFGTGDAFTGFDYVPERPQVTRNNKLKKQRIEVGDVGDSTPVHFQNFLDAVVAERPDLVNNPPDLGAAAVTTINLGVQSYREGKVLFFDADKGAAREADGSWSRHWEQMSQAGEKPRQIPGWNAGDKGSVLKPPEWSQLAGPWIDGQPPELRSASTK